MPKYTNSDNLKMITPQRRFTGERPTISDSQARAWWDALSNGAQNDLWVRVKLDEGRNLYYFTDEGTIVRAINEGDNLSDPDFLRGLMEKSMDGRLFTRYAQNSVPKQVITNPEEDFDVGIAEKSWAVPTDQLEEEPKAPFFLKILAYPFSKSVREEFQTYWKEKEEYQIKNEDNKWRSRFGYDAVQGDILSEDYEEVMRNAQEEFERKQQALRDEENRHIQEKEQKEREEYLKKRDERKAEWDKDVSQMTLEEFKEYQSKLFEEHRVDDFRNINAVIRSKYSTVDDLYDAMVRRVTNKVSYIIKLTGGVAISSSIGEDYWVASQMKPFQDAKAGMKEFLKKEVGEDLIKQVSESHEVSDKSQPYMKLRAAMERIELKMYDEYYFQKHGLALNPEKIPEKPLKKALELKHKHEGQLSMQKLSNDLNNQIKSQSQPQNNQAQQQIQQSEPAKAAAPSMGGGPG